MKRTGLFIICVALLLAGSVLAGSGTVTLKDGKEYKGVTFSVDTTDDVLIIEQGGWTQKIQPERIERVMDSDGLDVTASVLAALRYTPTTESPKPAPPEVKPEVPGSSKPPVIYERPQRVRRHRLGKPFDFAIGGRANYSVPFGDYYEGFTAGVGFEADMRIPVSDELAIHFLVSKSGIRVSDNWLAGLVLYPYVLDGSDLSASVVRYYIGLMQTSRAGNRRDFPDFWYFYFGIGAVAHSVEGSFYIRNTTASERLMVSVAPFSDTRFAQVFGGGYIIRTSKTVGIDLSGSLEGVWTRVFNRYTGAESVAMKGFSFDIKAGVVFLMGN